MTPLAEYRFLLARLIRRLRDEHGSEIHLYTHSPEETAFYVREAGKDAFASIGNANILYESIQNEAGDSGAVAASAQELEGWLGLTINELAMCDRHLGRGFSLAGPGHARSRYSRDTSLEQMLNGYAESIRYWRREIELRQPTLVLFGNKVVAATARRMGVPYRTIAGSRYRNLHYWAHDEMQSTPDVLNAMTGLSDAGNGQAMIDAPYFGHAVSREKFVRDQGFLKLARMLGWLCARKAYWYLKGHRKARGYLLREELREAMQTWRDTRRLLSNRPMLGDLKGKRFVFYPLQTEPEISIHSVSPEYFFQLETIAAVARDLPAGVLLAVKETFWATGKRPRNFYDQICDFKNVVMLDMLELGLDVVREAEAVVTISGTAGFEAAILGKPVITFGKHNVYNILPHVTYIDRLAELKPALQLALSGGFDKQRMRIDGHRFLEAVKSTSFELEDYDFQRPAFIRDSAIENALNSLVSSVEGAATRAAVPLRQ